MTDNDIKAKNLNQQDLEFIQKYEDKLSSTTTKYGKWINKPDEHEDHPGQALVTRSPQVIKDWAEKRKAQPATVSGTKHDNHAGLLRFDFPGYGGKDLKDISWDDWIKAFEDGENVFIFQEEMKNGNPSNFFQIDSPFREHS